MTSSICRGFETTVPACAFVMKIYYTQSSINWWKAFYDMVACEIWRLDPVTHVVSSHAVVLNLTSSPAVFNSPTRAKFRSLSSQATAFTLSLVPIYTFSASLPFTFSLLDLNKCRQSEENAIITELQPVVFQVIRNLICSQGWVQT